MKKQLILLITITFLSPFLINGQNSCSGFTYTSQGQIDSFEINNPGCTHIEGSVRLLGDFDNLYGLNNITSIDGNLELGETGSVWWPCVDGNNILNDTIGLQSLQNIGGSLTVNFRDINNFAGFENLQTIGGSFWVNFATSLNSFAGLENLQTIGGTFYIKDCFSPGGNSNTGISGLQNFNGLESLESIGGSFELYGPTGFVDFTGLEALTSIEGRLWFQRVHNDSLNISLTGLENLQYIGFYVDYYPQSIVIGGTDIADISALSNLNKLHGDVLLSNSPIASLDGLHNIDTILGSVTLNNLEPIPNLNGLENLKHIGKDLILGGNNTLQDISALENLQSVGGLLSITNNDILTSLEGLDSIDYTSITNLELFGSPNLAICAVKSICDYLANSANPATIDSNGIGCNNREEVENDCEEIVGVTAISAHEIKIYPNPTHGMVRIVGINEGQLEVLNSFGRVLMKKDATLPRIDLSELPTGLYFIQIRYGNQQISKKIIKL